MALRYNDLYDDEATGMITFSDVPNILNLKDEDYGNKAIWNLTITGVTSVSADSQYYVTFLDDTITNVTSPEKAVSKYFYISNSNESTAANIARALRNLSVVAANFDVTHSNNTVTLQAKKVGPTLPTNPVQTNIENLSSSGENGTTTSLYYNCKIDVDVYQSNKYVTTLEKNFYGNSCSFNVSPVLSSISEIGQTKPYHFIISTIDENGTYSQLARIPESENKYNYATVGYMVNQGEKYLTNGYIQIAQNYSRGDDRGEGIANNTILYLYENEIPISFYRGDSGRITMTINYVDSAGNTITSETKTWSSTSITEVLVDYTVNITPSFVTSSVYYIDLCIGMTKIRYNVIKPLKYAESNQRLLFRNSYGGISFIEMTGSKELTKDIETTTFEKNIYDYYTSDVNSLEKPYDIKIKDTLTLKSHLFAKNGKYIYNDLAQSPFVWTNINGETYQVIIDSINVEEVANGNDVYQATVKLHLSQPTSLL